MTPSSIHTVIQPRAPAFNIRHFFVPARSVRVPIFFESVKILAIIPTHAPSDLTVRLAEDLVRWNQNVRVSVVDDCAPDDERHLRLFKKIGSISDRVEVLRTPENTLKAGALNFALRAASEARQEYDVVLTLDDDVVIAPETVKNLVTELMENSFLGAVCSQCRVYNKSKNLLTRLQGLEYVGFNAIRLADEGLYRGPLVMHGMLTAFRAQALRDVGGFAKEHLIEDYEITTRLKERGWSVKSAPHAPAWTVVPETLADLWRQRTRWSYGGITVVAYTRRPLVVFQDILGHALFLITLTLVGALLFLEGGGGVPLYIAKWIIFLSFSQLALWYEFQLWLMRSYQEKDTYDWIIRVALLPEFAYSYVMTLALIGSYVFHSFVVFTRMIAEWKHPYARASVRAVRAGFRMIGYAEGNWNTRRVTQ